MRQQWQIKYKDNIIRIEDNGIEGKDLYINEERVDESKNTGECRLIGKTENEYIKVNINTANNTNVTIYADNEIIFKQESRNYSFGQNIAKQGCFMVLIFLLVLAMAWFFQKS